MPGTVHVHSLSPGLVKKEWQQQLFVCTHNVGGVDVADHSAASQINSVLQVKSLTQGLYCSWICLVLCRSMSAGKTFLQGRSQIKYSRQAPHLICFHKSISPISSSWNSDSFRLQCLAMAAWLICQHHK